MHFITKLRITGKNLSGGVLRYLLKNQPISNINLFEQHFFSQNGEDGIIRAIFQRIKTTNRYCVEFGIHENEGNTLLLEKEGWQCLLMDGNGDGMRIKKKFITAENIQKIFKKYAVPKEFDLLPIDIDSNDYWIWKAIATYSPRVVIIEYNASIPVTQSKSISYDPKHVWDGTNYFGASLLALVNLGKSKGYTLVGCEKRGVNAFFVRNDLITGTFSAKEISELYRPPKYGFKINGTYTGHPQSKQRMINV